MKSLMKVLNILAIAVFITLFFVGDTVPLWLRLAITAYLLIGAIWAGWLWYQEAKKDGEG